MTPDNHTNEEFYLDVGDGHELYLQDWGKKDAEIPIIFLHGGPGNGVDNRDRNKFDPGHQRVIFFDQRGCGKSIPLGSLKNNTTKDLVEDIEKIATHLKLKKFVLTGGSWGSCLALAYGINYPQRLAGIVIQGIFTGSHDEIDWLAEGRFKDFFPDVWDRYVNQTPTDYLLGPSEYHFKRALGDDKEAAKASAYAYENLEAALLRLDDRFTAKAYETYDPAAIRVEIHYLLNQCFMPDQYIFNNADKLTVPVWIVQGRYDMVCRPIIAYKLHQKLPNSQLIWTINGHIAEHEASNILRLIFLQFTGNI